AAKSPFTFYDLYTAGAPPRTRDRRQPLPSAFVTHFIEGGTGAFNTSLQIWREAFAAPTACPLAYKSNSLVEITDEVRFDEHENPTYSQLCLPNFGCSQAFLPSLSSPALSSSSFPRSATSGDVAGWLYLNLNPTGQIFPNLNQPQRKVRPSQAWVVTSIFAEGRYAVEMDAPAVGNGCSPAPALSSVKPIAPAPNNDDSCDIAVLPAATLLLPYFEVDLGAPPSKARTTLFTVQNTTPTPQIARVTLWTDWAYPMLTFNIFLTGYDIQSINLYDVFARGSIAPSFNTPGGTSNKTPVGEISRPNDANPHFLPDAATTCGSNPGNIGAALLAELQGAFTTGKIAAPGCAIVNAVGGVHALAIGYATIDVVANCNATS